MADTPLTVLDGPDKPSLQWALLYPERGQSVMFKLENELVEAKIAEMVEMGNGLKFGLKGTFCSGGLRNRAFHGIYSVDSRSGMLTLDA
jgi:hypothetical protein